MTSTNTTSPVLVAAESAVVAADAVLREANRVAAEAKEAAIAARRVARDEARRIENERVAAEVAAFREENYTATAGDNGEYVGVVQNWDGGIELHITEHTSVQSSVTLNRAQLEELIAGLTAIAATR